jgi:hypothetical protein
MIVSLANMAADMTGTSVRRMDPDAGLRDDAEALRRAVKGVRMVLYNYIKKRKLIAVLLLFTFMFSVFIVFVKSKIDSYSKEDIINEIVLSITLHANDPKIFTQLFIPPGYIEEPTLASLGQHNEFIILEMKYPAMAPLSHAEHTKDFSFSRSTEQDKILSMGQYFQIELHQGRISSMDSLIDDNIKNSWLPEPDDPNYPDFKVFSNRALKPEELRGYPILTRYYVPKNDSWRSKLYFQCPTNPKSNDNRLLCTGHTNFQNLLYGSYTFSKSHMTEWRDVDAKAREFVSSIIVKSDKAQ